MHRDFDGTDEGIVALARAGGPDSLRRAVAAALRRYFRDLHAHVRARLAGDDATAQDVLQDVALALVQGLPRVRSGAALRPWLLQIASHKVCDHLRRRHRDRLRVNGELAAAALDHLEDGEGSIERLLERAGQEQLAAYVRRTLDRLNPRQREAVTLVYFDGLSLEEAAGRLQIRPDAVAALLYRARRAFGRLVRRDRRAEGRTTGPGILAEAVRKC